MLTAPEYEAETEQEEQAWQAEALCATGGAGLTALFFSEELQDIAAAKRLCADCPVLVPCLEGAMARREPWGVASSRPVPHESGTGNRSDLSHDPQLTPPSPASAPSGVGAGGAPGACFM